MPAIRLLVVRNGPKKSLDPNMVSLLVSLLVLVVVGLSLIAALFVLRNMRRSRKGSQFRERAKSRQSKSSNHRRLTITASPTNGSHEPYYVYQEKQDLLANSSSPPPSPIPEIRITLPEEIDESGKRHSGRVVIVRIGEHGGVGLEPLQEDLPPYQRDASDRFDSLDLDRIGGLKEKDDKEFS